jgi:hypothetical protein
MSRGLLFSRGRDLSCPYESSDGKKCLQGRGCGGQKDRKTEGQSASEPLLLPLRHKQHPITNKTFKIIKPLQIDAESNRLPLSSFFSEKRKRKIDLQKPSFLFWPKRCLFLFLWEMQRVLLRVGDIVESDEENRNSFAGSMRE